MYHYIFPLPSEEIPSNQYFKPIKKAPYDIVAISCGDEAYADVVPSITVTKTVYCEGASESDTVNMFLLFKTEKTSDELNAIKSILDTQTASYDPSKI